MITNEEVAILDELVRLNAFRYMWKETRKRLLFIYLPYLTNNKAGKIFGFAPNTVVQLRSNHCIGNNIDIWEHPPPPIHPKTATIAAKMFITGQLSLYMIAKKLEVSLLELEKLFKPRLYRLRIHHDKS